MALRSTSKALNHGFPDRHARVCFILRRATSDYNERVLVVSSSVLLLQIASRIDSFRTRLTSSADMAVNVDLSQNLVLSIAPSTPKGFRKD